MKKQTGLVLTLALLYTMVSFSHRSALAATTSLTLGTLPMTHPPISLSIEKAAGTNTGFRLDCWTYYNEWENELQYPLALPGISLYVLGSNQRGMYLGISGLAGYDNNGGTNNFTFGVSPYLGIHYLLTSGFTLDVGARWLWPSFQIRDGHRSSIMVESYHIIPTPRLGLGWSF